ncbi:hypothetical protein NDU88_005257 [Pleurodeles waltl]|uniref:Uncharacterized protein n=1 Tax=Pleurodeles waltl TaxID=8319 RepID=A0AAV7LKM8_PLEWA|nr:hypothetical protein NDU88_005257 [Pleurodeles waltl]
MSPKLAGPDIEATQQHTHVVTSPREEPLPHLQPLRETASWQISSSGARPGTDPEILGPGPHRKCLASGRPVRDTLRRPAPPGTPAQDKHCANWAQPGVRRTDDFYADTHLKSFEELTKEFKLDSKDFF